MKTTLIKLQTGLWIILSLWVALWLSWQVLAQVNFGYTLWYQVGGIQQNIEHYAPLNKYRPDFAKTSDEVRLELFSGIVDGIQNKGQGLNQLSYENDTGKIPLLRQPEIVHLQDVANLVSFLNTLGWGGLILWISLSVGLMAKNALFPSQKQAGLVIFGLVLALTLTLISFGAENVFYQLHIWIFPENHPWFFYYEDSLMSTMMKAPHLFAYIGASLLGLCIALFMGIIQVFQAVKPTKFEQL